MAQSSRGPFVSAPKIIALEGEVVLIGPSHLHGALTPSAARETARRLLESAATADQQLGEEPSREPQD